MFRIFIALALISLSFSNVFAQDVLIDKKGNELPCQLIGADKKNFSYKGYRDPEFTTQKTLISKYRKIRYADGKEFKISPPPSGWIFFGAGPAIPLGSYASSSADNPYAGFAKTNVGLQFEAAIPAFGKRKQWSIVAITGGFSNELDNLGRLEWQRDQNSQLMNIGGYGNDKTDRWKLGTVELGIGYTIPLSWKFSFDQKAAIGVGVAQKYNEAYTFFINGDPQQYYYYSYGEEKDGKMQRAKSTTVVLHYGAAFRYFITRSIAIRISTDFQYCAPSFKVHQYITPDPPSGPAFDRNKTEDIHSKIFVMRLQFGVCFNLIPKNIDYGIHQ